MTYPGGAHTSLISDDPPGGHGVGAVDKSVPARTGSGTQTELPLPVKDVKGAWTGSGRPDKEDVPAKEPTVLEVVSKHAVGRNTSR